MNDDKKQEVQRTFSKYADKYVTSTTHSSGEDLPLMVEWAKPEKHWSVLDIATGGGHVAKQLAPYVREVFATDLTKEMLSNTATTLQTIDNIHYVKADAEDLPFLDQTFDFVTCRIAPHHFPNPERFIQESSRVLKPNGLFIMIDNIAANEDNLDYFYNTFEKMRDPSHNRALRITEWKNFLANSQLAVKKEHTRKKKLPFENWLTRTMDNELQMEKVRAFMQSAPQEIKEYFHIIEDEGTIEAFAIDEWMVLCYKRIR
ncbi:methyltransferase domain-containing protein [Pontibacillus yanchengensis]|uniref:Methyltransferase domain-containing protein n=2 Tax=Pontibacillus yanchengensis TaxID=462910 RepID=A0ACC7VAV3_9BACI|nr:methyltransferase domain-containing protein [Pontibacillus yanchengensis]MYL52468.1 methyltransferase domain-containing protein [Pontibacillus yanchengensis]